MTSFVDDQILQRLFYKPSKFSALNSRYKHAINLSYNDINETVIIVRYNRNIVKTFKANHVGLINPKDLFCYSHEFVKTMIVVTKFDCIWKILLQVILAIKMQRIQLWLLKLSLKGQCIRYDLYFY
jgi:hypothetical protein